MEKYSVWYLPYNKKYLITHPWQWVKCVWRNFKDAWRRSVYGWTYGDVWDWDNWFIHTTPQMFRYMADHGSAYPGHPPFDTHERWHDWLYEMADLIETASEEWQDEHNEYYKAYLNSWKSWIPDENGMYHMTTKDPEIREKFLQRSKELAEQGKDNVRRAMTQIGEKFYLIWD